MSYSFDAPLPESFYYPPYSIEDTSEGLEYRHTNIQDNVSPLFDEDLYQPEDTPSLDLGWQGHYWPSPTSPNSEHGFSSECVYQDLCYTVGPDTQFSHHSARFEYSANSVYPNATPSHISNQMVASHLSEVEISTPPPISDESYSSEASSADVDAYGETDSEYGGGSTLGSDCIVDGEDEEYLPSSSSRGSKKPRPSIARTGTRRISQAARRTRISNASSHPGGVYPSPPYVFTPTRTRQAPPGTPRTLPQSASRCPVCSYRPGKSRLSDLRRHYEGHFAVESRKYVCCGVRVDRVEKYSAVTAVEGDMYEHNGEVRIGKCWQVFSRRDALKRHLYLSPECICDFYPATHYAKKR